MFHSTLTNVTLEPDRIPAEWLLSGPAEVRSKILGISPDKLAYAILWECGAASYRWHYGRDEAYIVLSGEGVMTDENGVDHNFGPGDVAFFPAGTKAVWRHPDHFRKIAVLKYSMWRPLAFGLKPWSKALQLLSKFLITS
jgi:uncharacterized protein